ncbi:MAG: shikimate dehydrogenase [Clostridia bacterium]|nr:shikimate dehydrogenase [Clostridia bacterium]
MEYGCIGKKLPHSFSKIIHEKIGEYSYSLVELSEQEVHEFMKKHDFKAINVTIPYKETVIPYLDEISETAKAIGAVNTIVNKNGKLYGYNTDFYGMTALIERNRISLKDKKVAILGSGGTSKTSFAVAKSLGAKEIIRVSRTGNENSATYEELYKCHTDADVLINTTPVGMFPNIFESPVDLEKFTNLSGVIDAVYNPLSTLLVSGAKEKNIPAECGLYMLVAQAVKAYEFFTEKEADSSLTDRIFSEVLSEKKNIVLTGMPCSGKSTTGRILARKLCRKFIDTDAEIVKFSGMEISGIFERFGEEKFREIETEIIKKFSEKSGVIIATGGGAILKKENINALKMNGTIYFLDRPLEELLPTDDRPLASSKEAIKKRYEERYETYTTTADKIIKIIATPQDTASEIERKHFNENSCN